MVQTDYFSYAKNAAEYALGLLRELSLSTKITIFAIIAFIALMAYLRRRDTAGNNIRRARELHRKALELHEKGEAEEAAGHYKKASEYREKAEAQK